MRLGGTLWWALRAPVASLRARRLLLRLPVGAGLTATATLGGRGLALGRLSSRPLLELL